VSERVAGSCAENPAPAAATTAVALTLSKRATVVQAAGIRVVDCRRH
jgi:hypothetical protein